MRKINVSLLLIAYLMLFISYGCTEPGNPLANETAPEIPPIESFTINFSDFVENNPQKSGLVTNRQNWTYSAVTVGVWNLLITLGMAIPVASFKEALKQEPERIQAGHWLWSYNFGLESQHKASLHAYVAADSITWIMNIKLDTVNDYIEWFTGKCYTDGSGGWWSIKDDNQVNLISIEWKKNSHNDVASVKFTNVVPGGAENGGYIHFGLIQGLDYNASYNIYNKGQNNLTEIKWNKTSKAGRVKDTKHFGDSTFHCWAALGGGLEDVDCEDNNTAPTIPPTESMKLDFSDFDTNNIHKSGTILNRTNWVYSATTVGVWNIFISAGMALPTASFAEAFKHRAVKKEIGHWTWTFNFGSINQHKAILHAYINADSVTWKMNIRRNTDSDYLEWYTGKCAADVSGGWWVIKDEAQVDLVKIEWVKNSQNQIGSIKFTNIVAAGDENGGYIHSGLQTNIDYDAYYNIYNKGQDNLTQIKWNRTTKAGRVKDPIHFSDSIFHCWTAYNAATKEGLENDTTCTQ